MVQQMDVDQPQRPGNAAGGFHVLHGRQCHTIGVIVGKHHHIGAALDGCGHHILDVQTDPVGGTLPQPDRRLDVMARAERDQQGAFVVRPCEFGCQIAAQLFGGFVASLFVKAAAAIKPADLRQHMQQPGRGRADPFHGAKLFFAGFQHRGKVAEAFQQIIGDVIGIALGICGVKNIFQHLVVSQTVQPVVLHPLPHPLAMPLMPFVFCHWPQLLCIFVPYNSTHFAGRTQGFAGKYPVFCCQYCVDFPCFLYYYICTGRIADTQKAARSFS